MKVLIIAYYFPPQTSVGCFRTQRFVEYLAANGIDCHILSVREPPRRFHPYAGPMPPRDRYLDMPVTRVREWPTAWLRTPAIIAFRRLGRLCGRNWTDADLAPRFVRIDDEWGWIGPARRAGLRIARQFSPDLIYVSCPPFSSALAARQIAATAGLPYVLDFRDSWLVSPYVSSYAKRRYRRLNARLLGEAAALVVNTRSDAENYRNFFAHTLDRDPAAVRLIHNGYEMPFSQIAPAPAANEGLSLLYTGSWNEGPRSPLALLRGLRRHPQWRLISVGATNDILRRAAHQLGISANHIDCRQTVPKSELLPLIAAADALCLVQGETSAGQPNTHIAAKTFDYLASGKPVLALTAAGDNRALLQDQGQGVYLADAGAQSEIDHAIDTLMQDHAGGKLQRVARPEFLQRFSPDHLGAQLLETFAQALASTGPAPSRSPG